MRQPSKELRKFLYEGDDSLMWDRALELCHELAAEHPYTVWKAIVKLRSQGV